MQPKTRMTFRFDAPPKPQKDKLEAVPQKRVEESREEPVSAGTKHAAWFAVGPLQDDPYTLEEIIRGYEPQPAFPAAKGQRDDNPGTQAPGEKAPERLENAPSQEGPGADPDPVPELYGWMLQEESPRGWKIQRQSQTGGPSWWRALATVAGAVATGALFGYLVLTLFTGEPLFPAKSGGEQAVLPQVQAPEPAPASGELQSGAADNGNSAPITAVVQTLPEETYYFLQYGVFQSADSLEAALAALKNRGLPAAADRSDGFRAYAGAAPSKEEAELLALQMPDVEVFIKPVTVQPVQAVIAAESGKLDAFIASSHELARQLLRLSTFALQDDHPQPIEETELAALQENHRLWLQTVPAASKLGVPSHQAGAAMIQAINEAMAHADDYNRKLSRYHLWGIQGNVMELILADQELRSSLEPVR